MRRRCAAAVLAVLCVLPSAMFTPIAAAQNLPTLGDAERDTLSPLMERKLGEHIMRDIRRDRDYLDDAPLQEYLNNFGASLVSARPEVRGEAGYDFYFFGVRDPRINAFALPGGFIGVHSALLLAAQTESELASVLAHEIGHVSQRHIARMLGNQRQDSLIPLAGLVLAVLAARSSPDAAAAAAMGSQGIAIQRQLNFSRQAEKEADRVGLQILREGGYDASGMVAFFGRLQDASRSHSDSAPTYLRSHPLTSDRIADIQARIGDQRYRQRADGLDFQLARARVRVLQDDSVQGLRDATNVFETQLLQKRRLQTAAAQYGLAFIALKRGAPDQAESLLREAREAAGPSKSAMLNELMIDVQLARRQHEAALNEAKSARAQFPLSRAIAHQYADALIANRSYDEALRYLRDQIQLYRSEPILHDRLARTYAAQGKRALQHMALAESYALAVSLTAALDQLALARRAPDASFYDQSVIDAREREFQARWREQMDEGKAFR